MLEVIEPEILRIAEQYVLYKLDVNEGLFWLFNVREGTCFKLNETSFFILSCVNGKTSTLEILSRLHSRYPDEDPEKVSNDFREIVETLKRQNVLSSLYK
ncbi:MAG: PqqD family protein [Euryarchaeota archaeon]|nr:PqqD family protein [Euryarchaeota archaeon]